MQHESPSQSDILVPVRRVPSDYEVSAIREIHAWFEPNNSWFGRLKGHLYDVYNTATDQLKRVPGFEWTLNNVVAGLLTLINEITQDWVPQESVYRKYRAAGHDVAGPADVRALDLEVADSTASGLAGGYRTVAAAEGAATGYAGFAGIPTDIVALVALNLRAAGEYAVHYGFEMTTDAERLYALSLLDLVARPSTKAKNVAVSPILGITKRLARQQAFEMLEQAALTGAISRITKSLGIHLTKAKLAQMVPVTGAVVGGGYNAYYTSQVCNAAFHVYRRRFLIAKYGEDVVRAHER